MITGDMSQVDLPRSQHSGLRDVVHLLEHIDGIDFIKLGAEDVVRHRLVKQIIKAFEKEEDFKSQSRQKKSTFAVDDSESE